MATRGIDLPHGQWVEITAPLMMEDDISYVAEIQGPPGAVALAHSSESANPPADDADGQTIWSNANENRDADREYTKKEGRFTHMRSLVGDIRLVISEV